MQKNITPRLIPALLAIAFSGAAGASGFQLMGEQSASGIGNGPDVDAQRSQEQASRLLGCGGGTTPAAEGLREIRATRRGARRAAGGGRTRPRGRARSRR